MHGVVGEVQKERLSVFDGRRDVCFCFECQSFCQKRVGPVILFQMRHGCAVVRNSVPEVFRTIVAARCTDTGSAHVDIEAEIRWIGSLRMAWAEMAFPYVNRAVAGLLKQTR